MLFRSICVLLTALLVYGDDNHLALENSACDLNARNESCPAGFCCVRDEFLYTETLCRPLGKAGEACATKLTEFECHCGDGFRCASNIHGHVTSLFGKCYPIPHSTDQTSATPTVLSLDNHMTKMGTDMDNMETTDAEINHVTTQSQRNTASIQLDGDHAIVG